MRKIVLLAICLLSVSLGYAQCPDPGTMPGDQQLVCAENRVNLSSSSFSLNEGDVLVYAVHTSPTGEAGTILGISDMGDFSFSDLSEDASYNIEYYVSAIAGPDMDGDGVPDLGDDCTIIAMGTPTVFLAPIVIERWASCNLLVESAPYQINFMVSGGLPEYNNAVEYTFAGVLNDIYTYEDAQAGISHQLNENDEYILEVSDELCFSMISGTVTCSKCPAEDAAGTLSSIPKYACEGGSFQITAMNTNFDAARSLVYAFHSGSDTSLVNVLAINETGEFSYEDLKDKISLNQRYFISSVVGLNDDNGEPLIDPTNDDLCVRVAKGTPVTFVSPISIEVVENCDPLTGIATLSIDAEGGAPAFDNTQIYTVRVGNTDFSLLGSGTLTQGAYSFEDAYDVIVTDISGCEASFSGTIECQLVDSAPSLETPNFKLNYLAPMPVSNQVILDFTAKRIGEVAIQVYSVGGQLVQTQDFSAELGNNKIEMNLSNLSSGMYFLQLNTVEGVIATKLVKE
ncbi:MAG: T9SS type A sorting domain-containing protein [Chitinophagales bacterium]